jgi:hypothetical protein
MDINVKVKIESPELIAALLAFAEALPQMQLGSALPIKEGQAVKAIESEVKTEMKNEESLKQEIKTIALEEVREKLASLSQLGKQSAVKDLITKFGAKKLTDIDPACYEELLKEAEVL